MNLFMKWTHRHREQTCGCPGEEGGGQMEQEVGVSGYKLWHTE